MGLKRLPGKQHRSGRKTTNNSSCYFVSHEPMKAIKDKDVAAAANIDASTLKGAFRELEKNEVDTRRKLS